MTLLNKTIKALLYALLLCYISNAQAQSQSTTVTWDPSEVFAEATRDVKLEDVYRTPDNAVTIQFGMTSTGTKLALYNVANKNVVLYASNYITFKVKEGYVMTKIEFGDITGKVYCVTPKTVDAVPEYDNVANGTDLSGNKGWTMVNGSTNMAVNRISLYRDAVNCTFKTIKITYKEATAIGVTLHISSAKYLTYYNELGYFMPTGCSGYRITLGDNSTLIARLKYPSGTYVPENTPLLIKGSAGDYPLYRNQGTTGVILKASETLLKGDLAETAHSGEGTYYQFSYDSDKKNLGFYWQPNSDNGSMITNGAGKCYLLIPNSANNAPTMISGFSLDDMMDDDEETTLIPAIVRNDYPHDGKLYNLQGQLVDASYKGIVIRNGVKMLNK